MAAGYLRYPHIHGDLLTFTAGDDVSARAGRGRPGLAADRRRRAGELPALLPRRVPAGLDELAGREPRGLRGRHRGQHGRPAHLLGRPADQGHRVDRGGRGARRHRGEPAGAEVPARLRGPRRRRHAAAAAAVRPGQRRGHRGRGHRPAHRERGLRARVLEAVPRRPGRQTVDRHRHGFPAHLRCPLHAGAQRSGRSAGRPDADRGPAVLLVRSRGHREHLLVRAGRQRGPPSYRS